MSKTLITLTFIFYLAGCSDQEQIMIEPCAKEIITFDPIRTEEWKDRLSQTATDLEFSLINDSDSLSMLLDDNIFYIKLYDNEYLNIDKGGYSISVSNIEISEKLFITVFNSKNDNRVYCQKLASDILKLLSE